MRSMRSMNGSMMVAALALALGARSATAQAGMFSAAKQAAQKSANAADAHVEAEQHPEAQTAQTAQPAPKTVQKSAPPKAVPQTAQNMQTAQSAQPAQPAQSGKPAPQLTVAKADTITVPAIIYREAFEYENDGRRDPFVSLLTTNQLRPTLSDLKLSNIIYDPSGRRSIAVMRDMTNNSQYRVTTGSALGRMRVSAIHVLTVVFTIEEFGTSRMDSLVLRDTTKRGR